LEKLSYEALEKRVQELEQGEKFYHQMVDKATDMISKMDCFSKPQEVSFV
jgi:hypothetical protein